MTRREVFVLWLLIPTIYAEGENGNGMITSRGDEMTTVTCLYNQPTGRDLVGVNLFDVEDEENIYVAYRVHDKTCTRPDKVAGTCDYDKKHSNVTLNIHVKLKEGETRKYGCNATWSEVEGQPSVKYHVTENVHEGDTKHHNKDTCEAHTLLPAVLGTCVTSVVIIIAIVILHYQKACSCNAVVGRVHSWTQNCCQKTESDKDVQKIDQEDVEEGDADKEEAKEGGADKEDAQGYDPLKGFDKTKLSRDLLNARENGHGEACESETAVAATENERRNSSSSVYQETSFPETGESISADVHQTIPATVYTQDEERRSCEDEATQSLLSNDAPIYSEEQPSNAPQDKKSRSSTPLEAQRIKQTAAIQPYKKISQSSGPGGNVAAHPSNAADHGFNHEAEHKDRSNHIPQP